MGVNAYRCAHNPPSAELLAACDRLGMLVMDENRTFNTAPENIRQLRWMVRRDRNHPSIILWSVETVGFIGTLDLLNFRTADRERPYKCRSNRPATRPKVGVNMIAPANGLILKLKC